MGAVGMVARSADEEAAERQRRQHKQQANGALLDDEEGEHGAVLHNGLHQSKQSSKHGQRHVMSIMSVAPSVLQAAPIKMAALAHWDCSMDAEIGL